MKLTTFDEQLKIKAQVVEDAISALLPDEDATPGIIHRSIRYSALGGGKRLRGILVTEAATLCGSPTPTDEVPSIQRFDAHVSKETVQALGPARCAAAAIEMIHAYSLVHDDLPAMDDDDLRRGRPTNHKVFGEAMAILAGDTLLTRAFEVLSRLPWAGVDASVAMDIIADVAMAAGTSGLIGGQVVDIQSEKSFEDQDPGFDANWSREETLEYIHAHKTGALIRSSLRIGAMLAGANPSIIDRLDRYGQAIGLAFQIVDDLLDLTGDVEALGKNVGSDDRRAKLTYPVLYGQEEAQRIAKQQIQIAKQQLDPLGERADFLRDLADFVLGRDR